MGGNVGGKNHLPDAVQHIHVLLPVQLFEDVALVHAQDGDCLGKVMPFQD
jgi:hypothetical protein